MNFINWVPYPFCMDLDLKSRHTCRPWWRWILQLKLSMAKWWSEEANSFPFILRSGFNVDTSFFMWILRFACQCASLSGFYLSDLFPVVSTCCDGVCTKVLNKHVSIQITQYTFYLSWNAQRNWAIGRRANKICVDENFEAQILPYVSLEPTFKPLLFSN